MFHQNSHKHQHNNNELTRDFLNITLDQKKYIHSLKQCEKNLSKLNIPFNELYSKKYQSEDEMSKAIQIILNPELYQSIKNHVNGIEKFVNDELNKQKNHLTFKIMNRLINCENDVQQDLINQLKQHKKVLCDFHFLITEMEKIINAYKEVKDHNTQMIIENEILKNAIKEENVQKEKIINNIKYYKTNIRKYIYLIEQFKKRPTNKKKIIAVRKKVSPNDNLYLQTESRLTRSINSFNNTSENMRKTYNTFYTRTKQFYDSVNKIKNMKSFNSSRGINHDEIYKKIIDYMKTAKEKYKMNNQLYSDVYKSRNLYITQSNFRIINEEGFRKIFIDQLTKDQKINELYDKKVLPSIDLTKLKLLNETN